MIETQAFGYRLQFGIGSRKLRSWQLVHAIHGTPFRCAAVFGSWFLVSRPVE